MADRNVHYEAAFEDYLRCRGWPYVAVDEAKKSAFAGVSLKNFDFLVYSAEGPNLLVDVKGRKFPDLGRSGGGQSSRAWENWVTREDIDGLGQWEQVFGQGFQAVLVFAYWLQGSPQHVPFQDVHFFRQRHYAFAVIRLSDYRTAARPRSAKWQTLTMPARQFSQIVKDIATFL